MFSSTRLQTNATVSNKKTVCLKKKIGKYLNIDLNIKLKYISVCHGHDHDYHKGTAKYTSLG